MILLLLELSVQWVMVCVGFEQTYIAGVIGLFWTADPAKAAFWLKVCLLVVEFDRTEMEINV